MRGLAVGNAGHVAAQQLQAARTGFIEQTYDIEQCGLSAAAGAHDAYELALLDAEVHVLQSYGLHLLGMVELADFFK